MQLFLLLYSVLFFFYSFILFFTYSFKSCINYSVHVNQSIISDQYDTILKRTLDFLEFIKTVLWIV